MRNNYELYQKFLEENDIKRDRKRFLVLQEQSDPYYIGTPTQIEQVNWFMKVWNMFDFPGQIHIRRLHYRLVSLEKPVRMWNNKPYKNTKYCSEWLNKLSEWARHLDLIPYDTFEDKKNHPPIIGNTEQPEDGYVEAIQKDYLDLELPDFPAPPTYKLYGFESAQRYHIEIWCEKSTMNDILLPFKEKYGTSLVIASGIQSITGAYNCIKRTQRHEKPTIILYISDYDPNGFTMPRSVARHIQFILETNKLNLDIKLFPIVLTSEQIEKYNLPISPLKEAKPESSKRGKAIQQGKNKKWKEKRNSGATELDALEAIYPGELKKIIQRYVEHYYDFNLEEREEQERNEIETELRNLEYDIEQITTKGQHLDFEIRLLEEQYDGLRASFTEKVKDIRKQLKVYSQQYKDLLESKLEDEGFSHHPAPEADEVEDIENPLFDSSRDFVEQNEYYERYEDEG